MFPRFMKIGDETKCVQFKVRVHLADLVDVQIVFAPRTDAIKMVPRAQGVLAL